MNTPEFQSLPNDARPDFKLGESVCTWHEAFIEWAGQMSPMSPHNFLEAASVWILSTVAARRIVISYGKKRYTPLLLALVASSAYAARTTLMDIAQDVLETAGLGFFLIHHENPTPLGLWHDLMGYIPENYEMMGDHARDFLKKQWHFAAQRGWVYDEFGTQLRLIMRDRGPYTEFHHLFRAVDDHRSFVAETLAYETGRIERPSLALLADVTPTDLARYVKPGSAVWGDGFFGRFAFVCPLEEEWNDLYNANFPDTYTPPPSALTVPLARWHQRLGIPSLEIVVEKKRKRAITHDFPEHEMTLASDVIDAFNSYYRALRQLVHGDEYFDFRGNFIRLSDKCLRIAALFASFDGQDEITLPYWAKAQSITENWREDFHTLYRDIAHAAQMRRQPRTSKSEK